MKRLILILAAWLIPALAGAQGIPIYPQPLFRTSTPIFKGLGPLTGPVILDTTAGNTYARQMSPPALTSATPDNGSGSLAAGVYTITVVGVDLAGGVSLYPTAITCTVTGGTSHCDIVYVASVGAVSVRVYVSDVDGATPDRYFASTSATTYALTTLVGATVAALPTSNSAYRFSIGGETQNWWSLPMRYESGALGTTETEGLALQNLWPASTATTVQVSPSFSLLGNALNSTSTLSESHRWFAYVVPATVAGTTTSTLKLGHSLNGGAATFPLTVTNAGKAVFLDGVDVTSNLRGLGNLQIGGTFGAPRFFMITSGVGLVRLINATDTVGIGLDWTEDALLKVRTRAQTGDASLSALNIMASGQVLARESFDQPHMVRLDPAFTAKGLADGNINVVLGSPSGIVTFREELAKTVSSWVATAGYLDISADDTTDNEGVEILLGDSTDTEGWIITGETAGGCFSVNFTLTDNAGTDQFFVGWRNVAAFVGDNVYSGYTEWAGLGINNVDGSIFANHEINGGAGALSDDSTVNMADGETRTLKSCITGTTRVPTASYTANGGSTFTAVTLTNGGGAQTTAIPMVPFISYLNAGADAGIKINWWEVSRP